MDRVDVDFSGGSTQVFHIGAASCAVPGAAVGLEEAHRSHGSLPWRDLFQPAIALARERRRAQQRTGISARDPRPDPASHARIA